MMTKKELGIFIDAVKRIRDIATDEQAAEVQSLYPVWKEGVSYTAGVRVQYNEVLYKVLNAHTSQADWTPDAAPSLFAKVLIPNANATPEWEQPESTNPYMKDDKVTYNGKTYVSLVDNNVWSPDVDSVWKEIDG